MRIFLIITGLTMISLFSCGEGEEPTPEDNEELLEVIGAQEN